MVKSVLYITVDFPPYRTSGIYRPTRFGNRWIERGADVTVLTVSRHMSEQTDESMRKKIDPRMRVIRCRTPLLKRFTRRAYKKYRQMAKDTETTDADAGIKAGGSVFAALKRYLLSPIYRIIQNVLFVPDEYILWVPFAVVAGYRAIKRYKCDVIFASSPPHSVQLVGLALRYLTKLRYVVDFRNSWTDNKVYSWSFSRRIDSFWEKKTLLRSDLIVTMSPGDRDRLLAYREDFVSVPVVPVTNGYAEEDFSGITIPEKRDGPVQIVHLGTVYGRSGLLFLERFRLYVVEKKPEPTDVCVVFVGVKEEALVEYVERMELRRFVQFAGFIRHDDVPRYLAEEADIQLVLTVGDKFFTPGVLPGKIFEYMRIGKPILHIGQEGDTHDFLQESGLEIFVAEKEFEKIPHVLERCVREARDWSKAKTANEEAVTRFEWNSLADTVLEQMAKLFDGGRKYTGQRNPVNGNSK